MRVLYSFPTRLGTAGIGTTAWHQVAALAEHGHALTVVCASSERAFPDAVRVIETLRPGGVRLPFRLLGLMRAARLHDRRCAALLERMRGQLDVVHCWPLGSERTLATARRLGLPGLLERPNAHTRLAFRAVQEVCEELGLPVDRASPHAARADRLAREEREYELAAALLCPSDFVARSFRSEGPPQARLLRHRYGYDPARFGPEGRQEGGRPFTACFVGRGEPRKGLHLALRAWLDSGAAEHGRFVVAGSIEPAYRELLEPLLDHPSVEERGRVDDPAAVMRGADVLVLPSLEEGSALVTYEARACGCVLAVSDRSGAPGTDAVDVLVHPAGDVEALASNLRDLAADSDLLARLRAASVEGASELTWTRAGGVLAEAYSTALADAEPVGSRG
jgi:glycosyltransferase involved in cell wall biosynthesis